MNRVAKAAPQRSWRMLVAATAALGLAGFAGIVSYSGVLAYASHWWEAAALTAGIQTVIGLGAFTIFAVGVPFTTRVLALGAYAIAVIASVAFGYGYWFERFSGAQYRTSTFQVALRTVSEPILTSASTYGETARIGEAVAAYSSERAKKEQFDGGTCGGTPKANRGPRVRLREREARDFGAIAIRLTERSRELKEIANRARVAADAEDASGLAEALAAARAHRTAAEIAIFRELAEARIRGEKDGFKDPETGAVFQCPDDRLRTELSVAIGISLPPLPTAVPPVFGGDRAASVRRAFGILTFGALGRNDFDRDKDGMPLAIGIGVDVMILLLGLFGRNHDSDDGGRGGIPGRASPRLLRLVRGLEASPTIRATTFSRLAVAISSGLDPVLESLERYSFAEGRRFYLIVPHDTPKAKSVQRLVTMLSAFGLAWKLTDIEVGEVPEHWRRLRQAELEAVESCEVWELRRDLFRDFLLERARAYVPNDDNGGMTRPKANGHSKEDVAEPYSPPPPPPSEHPGHEEPCHVH